jgi:hypothetical protein
MQSSFPFVVTLIHVMQWLDNTVQVSPDKVFSAKMNAEGNIGCDDFDYRR